MILTKTSAYIMSQFLKRNQPISGIFLVCLSSEFRDRLILDIDPPCCLISRDSEQQSIAHLFHSIMQKSNDLLIQPE